MQVGPDVRKDFLKKGRVALEGPAVWAVERRGGLEASNTLFVYEGGGKNTSTVPQERLWFYLDPDLFQKTSGAWGLCSALRKAPRAAELKGCDGVWFWAW